MKRITISLPDELGGAIEREARRRHTSVSEIVREGLAERLGSPGAANRKIAFAAIGRSGTRDTARNAEAIFEAEWRGARGR